jgi:hypothetical protein
VCVHTYVYVYISSYRIFFTGVDKGVYVCVFVCVCIHVHTYVYVYISSYRIFITGVDEGERNSEQQHCTD